MKDQMGNELKKVSMAGVGIAAAAVEKTKETIDKYARKGEQVMNQSSNTIDSLKYKVKDKADDAIDTVKQKINDTLK